jgi:predicted secreted Zn-dependent protease
MTFPGTAAVATALALLLPGGNVEAAVEVEETLEHYDIAGSKAGQLKRAMKRLGPRQGGRRYLAYTQWELTWAYTFEEVDAGCRFATFDVRAAITMTLPRWTTAAGASPGLRERWERFLVALEAHERGHARIGAEAARSIDAAVADLGTSATCHQLEREAEATAREKVERYRDRERRYDEETNHGRKHGACL